MKKTSLRDIDKFFNGKKLKLLLIGGALIFVTSVASAEPIPESEYIDKLNAEITELEESYDELESKYKDSLESYNQLESKYKDSLDTQEEMKIKIEEYKQQVTALNEELKKLENSVQKEELPKEEVKDVEEVTFETIQKDLSKLIGDKITIEIDSPLADGTRYGYIYVEMEEFSCFTSKYKQKVYDILEYIQKNPIESVTIVGVRFMVNGSEFLDVYGNPCTEPQLMSSAWIEIETLEKINFENIDYLTLYENEFLLSEYYFNELVDDDIWN